MPGEELEFVVGRERGVEEVLTGADVLPLLRCAVRAGLAGAALVDADGEPLWSEGGAPGEGAFTAPLFLEGEPVGRILFAPGEDPRVSEGVAQVVAGALQGMVEANLKRMLTTEIHTQVVNRSYEELLEKNRGLAASEERYRELAESLEQKVRERTAELKRLYAHVIEQEKMASVGQLAAGVAHEINNPLGFILSNLNTLRRYAGRLLEMLSFYGKEPLSPPPREDEARKLRKHLKIDYIRDDMEELLSQSIAGAERMKKIVADLKGFSHIDDHGLSAVDLATEIDRTLELMAREIPEGTRIVREYGSLPSFHVEGGRLCQALFNILRNAFQCRKEGLEILIRTETIARGMRITVADNGPGIPEEVLPRIFDPFFTTRTVGEGVGLGLTVAYNSVAACGGTLHALVRPEGGAAFVIELPSEEKMDGPIR